MTGYILWDFHNLLMQKEHSDYDRAGFVISFPQSIALGSTWNPDLV